MTNPLKKLKETDPSDLDCGSCELSKDEGYKDKWYCTRYHAPTTRQTRESCILDQIKAVKKDINMDRWADDPRE